MTNTQPGSWIQLKGPLRVGPASIQPPEPQRPRRGLSCNPPMESQRRRTIRPGLSSPPVWKTPAPLSAPVPLGPNIRAAHAAPCRRSIRARSADTLRCPSVRNCFLKDGLGFASVQPHRSCTAAWPTGEPIVRRSGVTPEIRQPRRAVPSMTSRIDPAVGQDHSAMRAKGPRARPG